MATSISSDPTKVTSPAIHFLKAVIQQPAQVASVWPSSRHLTHRLANRECVSRAKRVVEIGPGMGETTNALLRRMPREGMLLAIEKTAEFIAPLQLLGDPRLVIEHGDAIHLCDHLKRHSFSSPDVIVSGVPFSALPFHSQQSLLKQIHAALPVGGTFLAYQFRSQIEKVAKPMWGEPTIDWVFGNLPPLRIYAWTKQ